MSVQDRARTIGLRLLARVKAMSPSLKIVSVVAALVVGVGGYVFYGWVTTPTYAPLFTNLAPSDASAVVDKLNATGIPYQLGANGTEILVPKQDVYSQRISLSAAGIPSSPQTGYSLLDNLGVTASEFQQHIDYQRALEGELDKTIQSIQGVQSAAVHLAIPQQDVWNDGSQKATASVLLSLDRTVALNSQQVTAVVNLVASSVPGLTTDNVTVTDSAGHVLSSAGTVAGASAGDQAAAGYEQRMTQQLQRMLDTLVGAGNAVVTVNADVDLSKTTSTAHTYTAQPSAPPLAQSTTSETYTGAGAASAGGVAGATAAPTASSASSGGGSYTKTTNTQNNAVGTVDTTTETAPGSVKKVGIAIVLNDSVSPTITPAALTNLVNSAAGVDPKRGDSVTVERLAFDRTAQQQAAQQQKLADEAAKAAATRRLLVELFATGLGLAVAVIGGVVVLARRRRRRAGEQDDLAALPEDLPEPDQLVPDKPWHELNLDASRKQLHDLATENPGDVAKVLRSWLSS